MEERLQKLIASAGIASRRKAEEMILSGAVTVNGNLITTLGAKADPATDHIKVNGKLINGKLEQQEKLYILLNKPVGYLTTKIDPQGRELVLDLLGKYRDKVHPVGRLDVNTEGLLLLTNDGQFTQAIAHAAGKVPKVYAVKVKGQPNERLIEKLRRGVVLDGVKTRSAQIKEIELSDTNAWFEVTLFEGRNQQIRKMFDSIGHSVLKLRRIAIGFLRNEPLRPGEFRLLRAVEVKRFMDLQQAAAKSAKPAGAVAGTKRPPAKTTKAAKAKRPPTGNPRATSALGATGSTKAKAASKGFGKNSAGKSARKPGTGAPAGRSSSGKRTGQRG